MNPPMPEAPMAVSRAALAVVLTIAFTQTASATEWRYCLASAYKQNTIYFSAAFASNAGEESADSAFERKLGQAGLSHDSVQCPRADNETEIMEMFRYAIDYNQKIGNKIVYVN
jgi:hypothetical protein